MEEALAIYQRLETGKAVEHNESLLTTVKFCD